MISQSLKFPATREEALTRLTSFLPKAGQHYASNRNSDLGPDDRSGVSVLSPYLRYRIITEQEVTDAVLSRHSYEAAEKYIQEVLWRTYWKGWLEMRPTIWQDFLNDRDAMLQKIDRNHDYKNAVNGTSGIQGFDDWAKELIKTGYLHNHARMWFASIWIFTLRLPWQLGADFFMQHLLDADPASNTLGWRWVAGLQTIGKTYLARKDNIEQFTNGRFSPDGLASDAPAIPGHPNPPAMAIGEAAMLYESQEALLLLHPDDICGNHLLGDNFLFKKAYLANNVPNYPWGEKARNFLADAMQDSAENISKNHGLATEILTDVSADILADAAAREQVNSIVTPYAPVGPVADWLMALKSQLAQRGIALHIIRREWDSKFWPHAKKGFFPFKKQIPALLST